MSQVIYDVETYPNFFSLGLLHAHSDYYAYFECSDYRDDSEAMFATLGMLAREQVEMVGFNNLGFDYPVVHHLIRNCFDDRGERQTRFGAAVALAAYQKAEMIIGSRDRFANTIWQNDRFIPQVDLYKIHHFDNPAKATSLKVLQFTMRAASVEDLPIAPGTRLTAEQAQVVGAYMRHDIDETKRFLGRSTAEIEFRRELGRELDGDVMNWSDVKIGSEILIQRLGKKVCYHYVNDKREPRTTVRTAIPVAPLLFPYLKFDRPECNAALQRFRDLTIRNTKSGFNDAIELDGFTFAFGLGGIHGSVEPTAFVADESTVIVDADVTGMYPSITIANRLAPEHLGEAFIREYEKLPAERAKYAKGTQRNKSLKLAGNGVYGNSNNPYSPFCDAQMTMTITINGQLSLLMFAERLLRDVPGLKIIQANTDGITCTIPPTSRPVYDVVCKWWEGVTGLALEFADYARFYCRDVNNYIAQTTDGKIKGKGAYEYPHKDSDYEGMWHKDWSSLVVQKSVEAHLLRGVPVEVAIRDNRDPFDFMCRYKTPASSKLFLGDERQQRVTRYYLVRDGLPLVKESPPPDHAYALPGAFKRKNGIDDAEFYKVLRSIPEGTWDARIHTANKSVYADRRITVAASAAICNRADAFDWSRVDYEWYIAEALKLTDVFKLP